MLELTKLIMGGENFKVDKLLKLKIKCTIFISIFFVIFYKGAEFYTDVYKRQNIPFDREERVNILDSFSQEKLEEIDALTDLYYEIEEAEWRKVTLWVKANSEKFLIQAEINDYSNWISTLD